MCVVLNAGHRLTYKSRVDLVCSVNMVKTSGKRGAAAAAAAAAVPTAPPDPLLDAAVLEAVAKVDRGLQSLMKHGDHIEVR